MDGERVCVVRVLLKHGLGKPLGFTAKNEVGAILVVVLIERVWGSFGVKGHGLGFFAI